MAAEILRREGVDRTIFASESVSLDDPQTYIAAYQWAQVQRPLEDIYRKHFRLDFRPTLHLVLRETEQLEGQTKSEFVLSEPGDDRIKESLRRVLSLPEDAFDEELRLIGELGNFLASEFKADFLKNGAPDLAKIQGVMFELLQSDADLKQLANNVGGSVKPVRTRNDLTSNSTRVVTDWQEFVGDGNRQVSWRVRVEVTHLLEDAWQVESVVDIGERFRSQSFNQIRKISDTNRLSAFENLPIASDANASNTEGAIVRHKAVLSTSEKLLTDHHKRTFGEMAPTLWQKVKSSIVKRD